MSWAGFKKKLDRTGTKLLQTVGSIEKTVDKEFEEEERRFKSLESKCEKLHKEAKGYLDSLRAITSAQTRISETIEHFYEDSTDDSLAGKKYKTTIEGIERDCRELDDPYRQTVTDPVGRFCAYFPDINDAIKKRDKKLLDYDSQRAKVRKLVDKPSDDANRLPRAEQAANEAREIYESLNTQLVNELPRLIDLRVPYFNPTFEALVKIQLKFCQESYESLNSLQEYFPDNDQVDNKVEAVLQKMRDLAICGMDQACLGLCLLPEPHRKHLWAGSSWHWKELRQIVEDEEHREHRLKCDRLTHQKRRAIENDKQREQRLERNRLAQRKRRQQQQLALHLLGRKPLNETSITPFRLTPLTICVHCNAKKFTVESDGFCCSNGSIALANVEVLTNLQELFLRTNDIGRDFWEKIRAYNSLFSFTSMGTRFDKTLANNGVYTFRVQGSVYHRIGLFLPSDNNSLQYLQLYIYDTDHEINNRLNVMPNLKHETIKLIKNMLDEVNPFVANFRYLSSLENITNYQLVIKADHGLDQRTYNTPTSSQVAAIWVDAKIRSEFYSGLEDLNNAGHTDASEVGKRIILPSSFTGGPRDMLVEVGSNKPTQVRQNTDEINQYLEARWISLSEAYWRIFGFYISDINPSIIRLQLHLLNCQIINYFEE
ncbi:26421_t:CDS:10, partial [Dentiscutata erythropus]